MTKRVTFANIYHETNNHYNTNVSKGTPSLQFEEIQNLAAYTQYIAPTISQHLLKLVQQTRLLLISVDQGFDKDSYLRYLAANLSKAKNNIPVKQWTNSNENNSLTVALKKEAIQSIFIIDKIHPKEVNYDLLLLKQIAQNKNAYILISTDLKNNVWKLEPALQKNCWIELKNFQYQSMDLKAELAKSIQQNGALIFGKVSDQIKRSLLDDANLLSMGSTLGSPEKIQLFVQYLSVHGAIIDKDTIQDAIHKAKQQNSKVIIRAFDALDELHKFIVLGFSFFDGFFDDQFFAGMTTLAKNGWAIRNEELKALDYCDLDKVSNYFNFNEVRKDVRMIKTKISELRSLLLRNNWNTLRRHLLTSLSTMTQLVIDSIDNQNENWELYGTREKRQRLREVLGETISDFGLHAPVTVQQALITLASHNDIGVQRVAAKAIARWRQYGEDRLLFSTLDKWQGESRFVKLVRKLMLAQGIELDDSNPLSPLNYIRATIVLTLGYASIYDKPDELSDKIIQLFDEFLSDTSPLVKNRIEFIIPRIVQHHAMRLYRDGLLGKFIDQNNLIFPTALGLARALLDYPNKTRKLMHIWISKHRQHSNYTTASPSLAQNKGCLTILKNFGFAPIPPEIDENTLEERDRVIITLIFTCQQVIKLKNENTLVTSKSAKDILFDLRSTEQHPIIKELLFSILISLIDEKKPEIADALIKQLKEGEEQMLMESLGERYLQERKDMGGGDDKLNWGLQTYAIWVDSKRPDTYIEQLMKQWILNGHQRQRQLAFEALIYFAALLNTYEAAYIEDILEKRKRKKEEEEEEMRLKLEEERKRRRKIEFSKIKEAIINRLKKQWNLTGLSSQNKKILGDIYPVLKKGDFESSDLETVANLLAEDKAIPEAIPDKIRTLWKKR